MIIRHSNGLTAVPATPELLRSRELAIPCRPQDLGFSREAPEAPADSLANPAAPTASATVPSIPLETCDVELELCIAIDFATASAWTIAGARLTNHGIVGTPVPLPPVETFVVPAAESAESPESPESDAFAYTPDSEAHDESPDEIPEPLYPSDFDYGDLLAFQEALLPYREASIPYLYVPTDPVFQGSGWCCEYLWEIGEPNGEPNGEPTRHQGLRVGDTQYCLAFRYRGVPIRRVLDGVYGVILGRKFESRLRLTVEGKDVTLRGIGQFEPDDVLSFARLPGFVAGESWEATDDVDLDAIPVPQ